MRHYVYQRMTVMPGGGVRGLTDYLAIAGRAFEHIYGYTADLNAARVAEETRRMMRRHGGKTAAVAMLKVWPEGAGTKTEMEFERSLLTTGWGVAAVRVKAMTAEYEVPFGGFPTGLGLAAAELFDHLAQKTGAAKSIRRAGERLVNAGEETIFGIRRRRLVTPPLTDGAVDSVERRRVMAAAGEARLVAVEEPIRTSELTEYDELFVAGAEGLTPIVECDGVKFMALTVERIASACGGILP